MREGHAREMYPYLLTFLDNLFPPPNDMPACLLELVDPDPSDPIGAHDEAEFTGLRLTALGTPIPPDESTGDKEDDGDEVLHGEPGLIDNGDPVRNK